MNENVNKDNYEFINSVIKNLERKFHSDNDFFKKYFLMVPIPCLQNSPEDSFYYKTILTSVIETSFFKEPKDYVIDSVKDFKKLLSFVNKYKELKYIKRTNPFTRAESKINDFLNEVNTSNIYLIVIKMQSLKLELQRELLNTFNYEKKHRTLKLSNYKSHRNEIESIINDYIEEFSDERFIKKEIKIILSEIDTNIILNNDLNASNDETEQYKIEITPDAQNNLGIAEENTKIIDCIKNEIFNIVRILECIYFINFDQTLYDLSNYSYDEEKIVHNKFLAEFQYFIIFEFDTLIGKLDEIVLTELRNAMTSDYLILKDGKINIFYLFLVFQDLSLMNQEVHVNFWDSVITYFKAKRFIDCFKIDSPKKQRISKIVTENLLKTLKNITENITLNNSCDRLEVNYHTVVDWIKNNKKYIKNIQVNEDFNKLKPREILKKLEYKDITAWYNEYLACKRNKKATW